MQTISYTVINHQARLDLGLSMDEYAIADLIHNLAINPSNKHLGWCYAKKEVLAQYIGTSRATVFRAIKKLVKLKLIEKNSDNSSLLKSTAKWYQSVIMLVKPTEEPQKEVKKPVVKEKHGNDLVNFCMETFEKHLGYPPTDKKPRYAAYNLVRAVKKTLTDMGKETTDERVKTSLGRYYEWLWEQEWSDSIQTMDVVKRKFLIYLSTFKIKK